MQNLKRLGFFFGLILVAFGAVLLLFPDRVIDAIGLGLGIIMVAAAILRGLSLAGSWEEREGSSRVVLLAVVLLLFIVGVFLLLNREAAVAVISVAIGIFALISAADRYTVARARKNLDLPVSSTVISGIIHLLFGIGMITMPVLGASLIMMVTGAYLIAAGVMVILSSCVFMDL